MRKSAKMINGLMPNSEMITMNYNHGELSLNHAEEYVEYMMKLID